MYIADEKKKNIERVLLKKGYVYSLYLSLCDKISSQWLIYNNLALLCYKIKTEIITNKKSIAARLQSDKRVG